MCIHGYIGIIKKERKKEKVINIGEETRSRERVIMLY